MPTTLWHPWLLLSQSLPLRPALLFAEPIASPCDASIGSKVAAPRKQLYRLLNSRLFLHPSAPREHSDANSNTEECLSDGGMCGRNPRRLEQQHRQSTQNSLSEDRTQCRDAQPLHPAPPVGNPSPNSNRNRQTNNGASDCPMAPLVANAPSQGGNFESVKRSRPVRNRQTGIIAGHQRSGNDQ